MPGLRQTSGTFTPRPISIYASRSFTMIYSVEYRLAPITGLLSPIPKSRKLTPQVDQILEARPGYATYR